MGSRVPFSSSAVGHSDADPLDRYRAKQTPRRNGVSQSLHSVRVIGPDRPGVAAELTEKLADGGINLRGFSASVIGKQFVAYIAFDSPGDANKAMEFLRGA